MQLAPAARLALQVFCVTLNCAVGAKAGAANEALLVLVTVTVCAALVWPTAVTAKVSCAGLTFSPDQTCPVPFSATVTGATPEVEEVTVSVAALPPVAAGEKITCTAQLAPLASVAPQVVVPIEKLPAAWPVIWKPTLAIGAPPVLVTVSASDEPAAPTCCAAKFRLDGLTPNAAG